MTTFKQAINSQEARTANGMKALASAGDPLVDLFYNAGAMRGRDITPKFAAAYAADPITALRLAQWLRDARGGAGERTLFRSIVNYLEGHDPEAAIFLLYRAKELGRWDDIIETPQTDFAKKFAFSFVFSELMDNKNGLAAKWMPRKGPLAAELRKFIGLSPKQYRQLIVGLSNTVEQKMCGKVWDEINFSHVPSVAMARYRKSFIKNAPEHFNKWLEALKSKTDKTVKVNAGAVYPYDILKGLYSTYDLSKPSAAELAVADAQWEALPNFVGDASIMPIVDVSGSMGCPAGGYSSKSTVTCMDVAISLGLYLADKNKGALNNVVLNFSDRSELINLQGAGSITQKASQLAHANWGGSTNLHAAFNNILSTAVNAGVPQEDMPKILLIMSDMQFNHCARFDDSAIQMIARKYEAAGYQMPKVVFWNLNAAGNAPAGASHPNVGLVSGFSPSIVKSVLSAKDFTPFGIMMETLSNPRYDVGALD